MFGSPFAQPPKPIIEIPVDPSLPLEQEKKVNIIGPVMRPRRFFDSRLIGAVVMAGAAAIASSPKSAEAHDSIGEKVARVAVNGPLHSSTGIWIDGNNNAQLDPNQVIKIIEQAKQRETQRQAQERYNQALQKLNSIISAPTSITFQEGKDGEMAKKLFSDYKIDIKQIGADIVIYGGQNIQGGITFANKSQDGAGEKYTNISISVIPGAFVVNYQKIAYRVTNQSVDAKTTKGAIAATYDLPSFSADKKAEVIQQGGKFKELRRSETQ